MPDLHVPEWQPHECVPTQDAYDATVRALEKHRERANQAVEALSSIRDLAYRGHGAPADALEAILSRAKAALRQADAR